VISAIFQIVQYNGHVLWKVRADVIMSNAALTMLYLHIMNKNLIVFEFLNIFIAQLAPESVLLGILIERFRLKAGAPGSAESRNNILGVIVEARREISLKVQFFLRIHVLETGIAQIHLVVFRSALHEFLLLFELGMSRVHFFHHFKPIGRC
jgi:hypothetical protein